MKEEKIDILSDEVLKKADAICFTSNGVVKANFDLVMGAGVAKAFKDKWPDLPQFFGPIVLALGNKVHMHGGCKPAIISFPTKNHWKDKSDLKLIIKSATELMALIEMNKDNGYDWKNVYLNRPGVGLGKLDYEKEVKPAIKDILDDRVTVCYL